MFFSPLYTSRFPSGTRFFRSEALCLTFLWLRSDSDELLQPSYVCKIFFRGFVFGRYFYFSSFNILVHHLLTHIVSKKKSAVILTFAVLYGFYFRLLLFPTAFKIFSLSVILSSLIMTCLGIVLFRFLC